MKTDYESIKQKRLNRFEKMTKKQLVTIVTAKIMELERDTIILKKKVNRLTYHFEMLKDLLVRYGTEK